MTQRIEWRMNMDPAHEETPAAWRAELADGRAVSIERLDDGASFLPRVGDAVGPVCGGLLDAARWASEFAGQAL